MDTKVIPLRELQSDVEGHLRRSCDSGQALVVELPDQRRVTIQRWEPEDDLIDELIAKDTDFQQLLERSRTSPRKPFPPPSDAESSAS